MAVAMSDSAWLAALLRFESALAEAEAAAGLITPAAADAVGRACLPSLYSVDELGLAAIASTTPVIALVAAIRAQGGDEVHRGATSQDAVDTAAMLLMRDGLDLLITDLALLAGRCADLAERHRGTVMAGRTLLQQAVPVTFGLKAANWLLGVGSALERLRVVRGSRLAVQLGGAAGTMDGFGESAAAIVTGLATRLELPVPIAPWHGERSRIAEVGAALWLAGGAAGKIAQDIVLMSQGEVDEVREGRPGGSSAMPHKRNSVASIEALAALRLLEGPAFVLLRSQGGEQERAAGSWQAEASALTAAFRSAAGVVRRTNDALDGLEVKVDRMLSNIDPATMPPGSAARDRLGSTAAIIDAVLADWRRRTESD